LYAGLLDVDFTILSSPYSGILKDKMVWVYEVVLRVCKCGVRGEEKEGMAKEEYARLYLPNLHEYCELKCRPRPIRFVRKGKTMSDVEDRIKDPFEGATLQVRKIER